MQRSPRALVSAFARCEFSSLYKHLKVGYVINVSDIYALPFQTVSKRSSAVAPTWVISCFYTNRFTYMPQTKGSLLLLNAVCKPEHRRTDLKHAAGPPNTAASANLLVF